MKKNRSVHVGIFTSIVFMLPVFAFAAVTQVTQGFQDIGGIVTSFRDNIVTALITLFATAAMAAFFYGIVQYIWGVRDGKPEKVKDGNKFMISGLIALFVMFSVWGIITYVQDIFDIGGQTTIVIPSVQIQGQGQGGVPDGTPYNRPITPDPSNSGLPASSNFCSGKAPGTHCALPSGQTGACGQSTDAASYGQVGCYAIPGSNTQCNPGEFPDANGVCSAR